jgi:hypothetical protein
MIPGRNTAATKHDAVVENPLALFPCCQLKEA